MIIKIYAAYKYFIFSFIATVLMLVAIIIIYANTKTMDISAIAKI
jgi:NADH:ubiquinone oxidoreductase subunit 4 (subunit M)